MGKRVKKPLNVENHYKIIVISLSSTDVDGPLNLSLVYYLVIIYNRKWFAIKTIGSIEVVAAFLVKPY